MTTCMRPFVTGGRREWEQGGVESGSVTNEVWNATWAPSATKPPHGLPRWHHTSACYTRPGCSTPLAPAHCPPQGRRVRWPAVDLESRYKRRDCNESLITHNTSLCSACCSKRFSNRSGHHRGATVAWANYVLSTGVQLRADLGGLGQGWNKLHPTY